jgi:serine/threonine protein kinase
LTRSRHPNIARMYGYWIDEFTRREAFFVFESLSNGSLHQSLCQDEKRMELSGKRRVKILYEIARALLFLHKGGITDGTDKYPFVHRDIRSANIYLAADYTAKLMDCGLSKFVQDPVLSEGTATPAPWVTFAPLDETNIIGTSGYICPAYASRQILTFEPACDIYSLGIVMFELITGWLQFGQSNWRSCDQNLARKYHDKDLLMGDFDRSAGESWKIILDDLCLLALSCVKMDIMERPKTEEVLEKLSDIYTRLVLTNFPVGSPSK